MKKRAVIFIAILIFVGTLAGVAFAEGQSTEIRIVIPFDFYVKKKAFPPGEYSITRLNHEDPELLMLRDERGAAKIIFRAQINLQADAIEKTQFNFDRTPNGGYKLSEIRKEGSKYWYRIL